jgi:hypothetical protein
MLDPSALPPVKAGQTPLLLVRRLGADDVTARRRRGSEEFGPLEMMPHQQGDGSVLFAANAAAATRCDSRSNAACGGLVSGDCASGFDAAASLGRPRTSIVNEGTARLNVVLATAHRSADSSRRRRPCEAKRNKAIGDYRRDKPAISGALVARWRRWRDVATASRAWESRIDVVPQCTPSQRLCVAHGRNRR